MQKMRTFASLLQRRGRALSSAGSERLPYKQRVGGSNPSAPTRKEPLLFLQAHRALSSAGSERLPYKQRVGGSNPSAPTKEKDIPMRMSFLSFAVGRLRGCPRAISRAQEGRKFSSSDSHFFLKQKKCESLEKNPRGSKNRLLRWLLRQYGFPSKWGHIGMGMELMK